MAFRQWQNWIKRLAYKGFYFDKYILADCIIHDGVSKTSEGGDDGGYFQGALRTHVVCEAEAEAATGSLWKSAFQLSTERREPLAETRRASRPPLP